MKTPATAMNEAVTNLTLSPIPTSEVAGTSRTEGFWPPDYVILDDGRVRLNAAAWRAIVVGALALVTKIALSAHALLDQPAIVIVTWLATAAFVVVGVSLIVIDEAPVSGWLCIAVACATTIGELNSDRWRFGPWPAIGYVLELTFLAAAVLLCLSYPDRPSRRDWCVVTGLLAFSVALRVPILVLAGWLKDGFYDSPGWGRIRIPDAHDVIVRVGRGGTALILVGVAVLLIRRAWRVRGLARQSIMGLAAIGAVTAIGATIDQAVWLDNELREAIKVGGDLRNAAGAMVPIALLTGLLRRHFAMASVHDRVLSAARAGDATGIQRALSDALADPTVVVELATPRGTWIAADGSASSTTRPPHHRTCVVTGHDRPVLRFGYDERTVADQQILTPIQKAIRLGMENLKLHADLMTQMVELEESRARIATAALEERRRVERDLHDGAQQRLLAVAAKLALVDLVPDDEVRAVVKEARGQLGDGLGALRDLARGLYPPSLVKGGLRSALPDLGTHAQVRVDVDIPEDLPRCAALTEATAYFVVAEALTNITKHAPDATARVSVAVSDTDLEVTIADNGRGGVDEHAGSGLTGLRDRVHAAHGRFRVHDDPCGEHPDAHGVLIQARLPAQLATSSADAPSVRIGDQMRGAEGGSGRAGAAAAADRAH